MRSACLTLVAASVALSLTGCSVGFAPESATPTASAVGAIHGTLHGGREPIVGAHIYALQASTSAYNAASTSVLTYGSASFPIATDNSGGATNGFSYITTDGGGNFALPPDTNTCTAGSVVYLYALGGNPGSGTNTASGLLAVLGVCPSTGYLSDSVTTGVDIDELTTIAGAYALAPFATDVLHIGAPSATDAAALTAIQNAAANAAQLVSLADSQGGAYTHTPNGNGLVPTSTLNTLGNILAACVNSTGPSSSACSTIFTNVFSGGTTGTSATDTATAAIYIAQHPAITAYTVPPSLGAPYQPALNTAPNDYTVGILYSVGLNPQGIAIDASGNAWITNNGSSSTGGGSVTELSPTGVVLSGSGGFTAGGIANPEGIAIDQSGSAWITDSSTTGGIIKLTSTGTVATGSFNRTAGVAAPTGVAIDASGNAWLTDPGAGTVYKLSSTGALLNTSAGYNYSGHFVEPIGIAIDHSGNVWVADVYGGTSGTGSVFEMTSTGTHVTASGNYGFSGGAIAAPYVVAINSSGAAWVPDSQTSAVTEISSSGSYTSGSSGFSGGGINGPVALAIDGNGNVWTSNQGSNTTVSEISSSGAAISGSNGYSTGEAAGPSGIAVDGSGDVWIVGSVHNNVLELIGAAAPTLTPLCAGLATGKTPAGKP